MEEGEGEEEGEVRTRVAIIGGGVVGLSILRHLTCLTKLAEPPILVEGEPHLLMRASGNNSGISCTGTDAPLHSLERALIRDSISNLRHHLQKFNLPNRPVGSLVCEWAAEDDAGGVSERRSVSKSLVSVLDESVQAGDEATLLSAEQTLELEPNINARRIVGAVHVKGEIVLDPWLVPISYASEAVENGARILTNFRVIRATKESALWKLEASTGRVVFADVVISCCGNEADNMFSTLKNDGEAAPFTNKPRLGQYCIFEKSDLLKRVLQVL